MKLDGAITYDQMDSPVGELTLLSSPRGLHAILWDGEAKISNLSRAPDEKTIAQTKRQLNEYFQGKRKGFDLPLVIVGTDFQKQVWNQLLTIPYAATISCAQRAEQIGHKNKARAVGMANGRNPISIVVPCHRVIGSNGHLVGFGGGIERKRYLLQMEQTYFNCS